MADAAIAMRRNSDREFAENWARAIVNNLNLVISHPHVSAAQRNELRAYAAAWDRFARICGKRDLAKMEAVIPELNRSKYQMFSSLTEIRSATECS